MKTCACFNGSIILHSFNSIQFQQQQQQRYLHHYLNLPSFPIHSLSSSSPLSLKAIPRNIEDELSSSSNDTVLPLNQNSPIQFQPPPQNDEAPLPPTSVVLSDEDKVTTKLKKKKEQNDDDSSSNFNNRFKLRNGKEVHKSYFSIFNFNFSFFDSICYF
jgi:hypothetical protein